MSRITGRWIIVYTTKLLLVYPKIECQNGFKLDAKTKNEIVPEIYDMHEK